MTITIYSKLVCGQCDATYRALLGAGINITVRSVENDKSAHQKVKDMGYMQAPVVVTDENHWSGFRPDKIDELKARFGELTPRDRETVNSMIKTIKESFKEGATEVPSEALLVAA